MTLHELVHAFRIVSRTIVCSISESLQHFISFLTVHFLPSVPVLPTLAQSNITICENSPFYVVFYLQRFWDKDQPSDQLCGRQDGDRCGRSSQGEPTIFFGLQCTDGGLLSFMTKKYSVHKFNNFPAMMCLSFLLKKTEPTYLHSL